MLRILCSVALAWSLATVAHTRVTTPAKVRYLTEDGRSRWYEMDVSFMTGSELNTATGSYRYSGFSHYAVIFFKEGQAAVIKISTPLFGCGFEFSVSCFPSIGNIKGRDQDQTEWEICTGSFC